MHGQYELHRIPAAAVPDSAKSTLSVKERVPYHLVMPLKCLFMS